MVHFIHTAYLLGLVVLLSAHPNETAAAEPTLKAYSYGPHERNVLDLWQAKSATPTPLVVWFHGGGFDRGDKKDIQSLPIDALLEAGVSVISANYRLTPQAKYPDHYHDCARVVQTARLNHDKWNLDPDRIASSGSRPAASYRSGSPFTTTSPTRPAAIPCSGSPLASAAPPL